jgi:hypothetical protein
MPDQPSRVTPREISDLLDRARGLDRDASLDERIAYHEHKAALLSRIAADLGTADAHEVAAQAWEYAASLCRTADTATEVGR